MASKKHAILASVDLPLLEVEVPEWGETVYLRTLSVGEGLALEEAKRRTDADRVVGLYLTYALGDDQGRRLFDEADVDDLYGKSPKVLMRLFHQALAHNRMGEADDEDRAGKS